MAKVSGQLKQRVPLWPLPEYNQPPIRLTPRTWCERTNQQVKSLLHAQAAGRKHQIAPNARR